MAPTTRKPTVTDDDADDDFDPNGTAVEDDDPILLPARPGEIPIKQEARYARGGVVKGVTHHHNKGCKPYR